MKITDSHVSIPPYISTAWENISSLHSDKGTLVFSLLDGNDIEVPHLSKEEIDEIFSRHAHFLETHKDFHRNSPQKFFESFSKDGSMFNLGAIDAIGEALTHNPQNSHMPPIPPEMAKKIEAMSEMMGEDEKELITPPEDNCMCLYCQIARHILHKHETLDNPAIVEENVSEEELRFEEWAVEHISDKMYKVTNKLDKTESYNVFLGEPIGCTCGKSNCEHVVAALRS